MATVVDRNTQAESETPTRDRLMYLHRELGIEKAFSLPFAEISALQIKAAQEMFALRRGQISVLDRRARETGIDAINSFEDIVPLLFSHTTYKSYPMSFVTEGKWDKLLRWFSTLVAKRVDAVDLAGVTDFDGFVNALWAAGHRVVVTNGTSGKVSLLERTPADDEHLEMQSLELFCWPRPPKPDKSRHLFMFGPPDGPYMAFVGVKYLRNFFCRPDSQHFLTDEPLNVASVVKTAQRRTRMAEGAASPGEIAQWEDEARAQAEKMGRRAAEMIEMIIEKRREPQMIGGPWAQVWKMVERARALGVPEGEFHPETMLICGGGTKGADLPPDYNARIMRFLGPVRQNLSYSMSEMGGQMYRCEAGNYHTNPWTIPLLLDATGENLLPREGVVEGRFACLDLGFDGRWGGIISGDKVTMDYTDSCACGRPGAVVLPNIARYKDLGEEDKIGCAGTIDGYIRGVMAD